MSKPREFFGESYESFSAAMQALHVFARMSGAPPGACVVKWFDQKFAEYIEQSGPPSTHPSKTKDAA